MPRTLTHPIVSILFMTLVGCMEDDDMIMGGDFNMLCDQHLDITAAALEGKPHLLQDLQDLYDTFMLRDPWCL
ncbi:hypothetical protein NDU88_004536 [Pleurodeles waltl]|uniref:Endonuclease/exonuclease/phosphatase domain-containing protein n=1 Tax=Pleurodeles waltl TaxID=8319 RepID=A0AAV7T874_PLEWA|nr:hypothetical protein NDU88_004536 [Pleurodeles waltl]